MMEKHEWFIFLFCLIYGSICIGAGFTHIALWIFICIGIVLVYCGILLWLVDKKPVNR